MIIIDIFSPNHFAISRLLENIGIFIIDLIINGFDSKTNLILRIIMYILLILSSFIYNEFLVINICGLSKNTKLFLDEEAENEKTNNENPNNIELIEKDNLETNCNFEIGEDDIKPYE